MLTLTSGHIVRCARVFAIEGTFTKEQENAIKAYYINPVDSREASLELPNTLALNLEDPKPVATRRTYQKLWSCYDISGPSND